MITLYLRRGCPFCKKVLETIHEEAPVDYEARYIDHEENRAELVRLGGKQQVPFLVDLERDTMLYGSDDIVEYVVEHFGA